MNLIAGATSELLKESDRYHIFDDGFVSRTLFCFETQPRFTRFHVGVIDDSQDAAFNDLLNHIKRLAGVFGQLTYPQSTYDWLENWVQTTFLKEREDSSPKMLTYYGRKIVLIKKLAAAMHFSEHFDFEIPLATFQRAIDFLKPIEAKMKLGFSVIGRNSLHPITQDIRKHLKSRLDGDTLPGLLMRFGMELTLEELNTLLQTLQMAGEVYIRDGKYYGN